ncbi:MAG: hypothetical protein JF887_01340 [Candidatus Dormibacteraeota bacterium]|uniref:Imelysin-like domain-containing protein n=1 Tax=Candidatus Amunia macphersoniae TaxID=3127014 RepID=A0A934N8N3_9BACT|nr:hypothetical protein [Candidatus Dormibacteraeota bacterium]
MGSPLRKLASPVFVVALAACGGGGTAPSSPTNAASSTARSSSSSAAATGSGADAICANYNTNINAIPAPLNPAAPADATALPAIASWLDMVLVAARQEQAALKAASDAAPVNASFGDVITTLAGADSAAKVGDVSAYKAEFANFSTANTAFHTVAGQSNLPNCAK